MTRAGRRTLVAVACLLALAGIGFLAYPWLTDVYTSEVLQRRLRTEFTQPEVKTRYERHQIAEGDGLTRIVIPKLGVDTIVVEGISPSALRAGAGHYPDSPLPGENGNMAIAGHRTTYGKPFADIDELSTGDEIDLYTPIGAYVYKVDREPFVIEPDDRSVLDSTSSPTLTLTACHPKYSAANRIVIKAAIVPDGQLPVPRTGG
jgi:sortase A